MQSVKKYSLDALLSAADSADIIKDVRTDLKDAIVSIYPSVSHTLRCRSLI